MLGPFNLPPGENLSWNSYQENELVDTLALHEKPRKEHSSSYDVIIVIRNVFPSGSKPMPSDVIFLAFMCRLPSTEAIFQIERSVPHEKRPNKMFPVTCVTQKAQSKTGIYVVEEIYGLEALTCAKKNGGVNATSTDQTTGENSTDGDSTVDCVICLTDPR